jgi:OOP family OmpA-OmpF porin
MAGIAWWGVTTIEARTAAAVRSALLADGITWAEARADGLAVHLTGTAPNEAARFRAVNLAGGVIDAGRVRDSLDVEALREVAAPEFSVEILRNLDGISLIGLLPAQPGEDPVASLAAEVQGIARSLPVADMLESAEYTAPEGWQAAVGFGVAALRLLPRSKISISADRVAITAISDSAEQKRTLEAQLAQLAPQGLRTTIDISAPRPVLTPFTLRFVKDAQGARFDACSADTDRARDRILAAAAAAEAGASGRLRCMVGLGVPTPRWAEATAAGIAAVAAMGAGSVTFSDADVSLQAGEGVDQAGFDRAVGELRAALPDLFSLTATMPAASRSTAAAGPAEFTAALADDGRVELRGRVTDDLMRAAVTGVAKAEFGADAVYNATRTDDTLPEGWPVRVMAGLDALGELAEGTLVVRPDRVTVRGITGSTTAGDRISQILSARLGPGAGFDVQVAYDESRDPLAAIPEPVECVARVNAVLALLSIPFAPGSSEIGVEAAATLDALAGVLETCPPLAIEVGGHTDSQGSEGGNERLSQARAEAVMVGLSGRRIDVTLWTAKGYGESRPIADNATEEGREANRRIEFTALGLPEPVAAARAAPEPSSEPPAQPSAGPVSEPVASAAAPAANPPDGDAPAAGAPTATLSTADDPTVVPDPAPPAADAVALAQAPAGPGLGETRGITLPLDPVQTVVFEPSEETSRRPRTRPAD